MQEGDYDNHRMLFPEISALRTDENFVNQKNEEHHIGRSIFERASGNGKPISIRLYALSLLGGCKKNASNFYAWKNQSNKI